MSHPAAAHHPEKNHPGLPPCPTPGHRGHADAPFHGEKPHPHPGRIHGRGQRHPGRRRLRHALGGDRRGGLSRGDGQGDAGDFRQRPGLLSGTHPGALRAQARKKSAQVRGLLGLPHRRQHGKQVDHLPHHKRHQRPAHLQSPAAPGHLRPDPGPAGHAVFELRLGRQAAPSGQHEHGLHGPRGKLRAGIEGIRPRGTGRPHRRPPHPRQRHPGHQ